jgi:hypothetical protein
MIPSDKCISYQRISYNDILQPPERFKELWSNCLELLKNSNIEKQVLDIEQQETSVFDVLTDRTHPGTDNNHDLDNPLLSNEESASKGEQLKVSFSSFSFRANRKTTDSIRVLPVGMDQYGLKPNRTYMVVGGVRGFGFEVARWMAHKGKLSGRIITRRFQFVA